MLGLTRSRRPYEDFLAALGQSSHGDRAGIDVGGGGRPAVHGSVTVHLLAPQACADKSRLSGVDVHFQAHAGRLRVSLYPASSQASDSLRTRCSGPADGYGFQALATATVPLSTLTHRIFTVTLHGTKSARPRKPSAYPAPRHPGSDTRRLSPETLSQR